MPAITISREFGSVDDGFGERIARALGYHCLCKEEIATLLGQYGVVEFGREYETLPGFWESFDSQREKRRSEMVAMLNQVVQAVARHGNVVIQGRSGFAVLRDFADVLHVRLQAPVAARVANVVRQQQVSDEQAATIVKDRDRVRKAFVESFYGVPWDAVHAFDLVVNTGKIQQDVAVSWVVSAMQALTLNSASGRPTTESIAVDSVLANAVSEVLQCRSTHA